MFFQYLRVGLSHAGADKAQLQRLEDYYNIFQSNHGKALKCKDYDPSLEYFTSTFVTDVSNYYHENKGQFDKIILDLERRHVLRPIVNHSTIPSTCSHVNNVTPNKAPEFSGRFSEWATFRDLFKSVIHDAEKLTDLDRFCYLKVGVHGKAFEIVKKYKLNAANYPLAWQDLVSHYENKKSLVTSHLNASFNSKPINFKSAFKLEKFEKHIDDPIDSTNNAQAKEVKNRNCSYCLKKHFIASCNLFRSIDVQTRGDFVKEHNLCPRCLGAQTSQVCNCKKDCDFWHFRHHSWLHYGKRVLNTRKSDINSAAPHLQENHEHDVPYDQSKCSSSEPSSSIEEPVLYMVYGLGRDSTSLLLSPPKVDSLAFINSSESKLPSNSCILLGSNMSRVLNSRVIEIFLRVLIDPCSQASLISGSPSQRLNLISDVTVPIKGTGSISLSVQVLIKRRFDWPFSSQADTFILSSISSNTPTFSISTLVLPHLFGLLLTDHQFINKSHINVLLGATAYTQFLEAAFIKGILNEPLTTPSTLVCWLSVQIPATGTYRATHNSSFNPVQNCSRGKFFQIYLL